MHYRWYYLAKNLNQLGLDVKNISGSYSHHLIQPPAAPRSLNHEKLDGVDYCWVRLNRYRNNKDWLVCGANSGSHSS